MSQSHDDYPNSYWDPEPSFPEVEETNKPPKTYLEQDIATYTHRMEVLNRGVMPGTPDPALDLRWITNTTSNSLGESRLTHDAMRLQGYKTYKYANATDRFGRTIPDYIALYVHPGDEPAVRRIMDLLNKDVRHDHRTFSQLLYRVTRDDLPWAKVFDPRQANETRQRLIPPNYAADAESLMERAFLTARVFFHIRHLHSSTESGVPTFIDFEENLATYERLRERGVQPFSVEELVGMAASSVNYILQHNDIPAPSDQDED